MTTWETLGKPYGVLPDKGGQLLSVFGNPFWLKVSGGDSNGSVALMTATFAPGSGAVPHLHRGHDECFFVLDGQFSFRVGNEDVEAGPGALCYAPRNAAHGFTNIGKSDGSLLGVIAPAGYEQHFIEISNLPPGNATKEALGEIFRKYDQEPA